MSFDNDTLRLITLVNECSSYRIIGLDVGTKSIGIALYRSELKFSLPLLTLKRSCLESDVKKLMCIFVNNDINGIVIGLPMYMNGQISSSASVQQELAQKLGISCNLPIFFYDERLTTAMANKMLKETNLRRIVRNKVDNEVAACIVLDGMMRKIS